MNRTAQKSALFEADVALQFAWYAHEAGEQVAWRFLESVEQTLAKLVQQPDLGRIRHFRHSTLRDLRSICVGPPFGKLLIFYRVNPDALQVWRLMHGTRDLSRRLREPPGTVD